jgi:hypothetical protein
MDRNEQSACLHPLPFRLTTTSLLILEPTYYDPEDGGKNYTVSEPIQSQS